MTGPEIALLVKGVAVGFSVSAPVGPIGVVCIRRTLADGPRGGLAVGLGAATVDGLFATVAALGLTAVSSVLLPAETLLRLAGGGFLLFLAWRALRLDPEAGAGSPGRSGIAGAYATGFALLGTNPIAIVFFTTVFAGFGLESVVGVVASLAVVGGVVIGALMWWIILTTTTSLIRSRLNGAKLAVINRVSAVLLAVFAVLAVAGALD